MTPRTEFVEKIGESVKTIDAAKVIVLRADCKYVMACHPGGELLLNETLTDLEAEFAGQFIRTHRAYLVRREAIGKMLPSITGRFAQVEVKGMAEPVPLSRRCVPSITKLSRSNE